MWRRGARGQEVERSRKQDAAGTRPFLERCVMHGAQLSQGPSCRVVVCVKVCGGFVEALRVAGAEEGGGENHWQAVFIL